MTMRLNRLYDQFHVENGFFYTEDFSFSSLVNNLNLNLPQNGEFLVPVTFQTPPMRTINAVPNATATFIVLRHLHLNVLRPVFHREEGWSQLFGGNSFNVTIPIGGGNVTTFFATGPVPSGLNNGLAVPVALRKMIIGPAPTNTSVTQVAVRPHWDPAGTNPTFENLNPATITTTAATIDLTSFYDNDWGLVNDFIQFGVSTTIDIQLTTTNTTGSTQNLPVQLFGQQKGQSWTTWDLEFRPSQSWGSGDVHLGNWDDQQNPTTFILLNKLVPATNIDTGIVNFGSLVFRSLNTIPFYSATTFVNVVLGFSVAYMVPVGAI